jgi:hypothetical protein
MRQAGRRHPYRLGSVLIVVALIALWRLGTFDTLLMNAGLNAKPCGLTALGTTVCGKGYEALHNVQAAREKGEEAAREHEATKESEAAEYDHQAGTEAEQKATGAYKREARREAEAEAQKEWEEDEARSARAAGE